MSLSRPLSVRQFQTLFQIAKELHNFEPNESFQELGLSLRTCEEILVTCRIVQAYLKGLIDGGAAPSLIVFGILDFETRFEPLCEVEGTIHSALKPELALGFVPLLRGIIDWLGRLGDTFNRTGSSPEECIEVVRLLEPIVS
jgi:hypothetical protein